MKLILRWLATALRDWLNGYIDPGWKLKQDKLQRDAAAFQRQHAETEKVNAEIDKRVAVNDAAIVVDEAKAVESETRRVVESERIEHADNLKELWFPKNK